MRGLREKTPPFRPIRLHSPDTPGQFKSLRSSRPNLSQLRQKTGDRDFTMNGCLPNGPPPPSDKNGTPSAGKLEWLRKHALKRVLKRMVTPALRQVLMPEPHHPLKLMATPSHIEPSQFIPDQTNPSHLSLAKRR